MIELLRMLMQLFDTHAPETLMAFFGAGMSILLFYLVWSMLRHWFGLQTLAAGQDAEHDQGTTALLEALVNALVTEAAHLRVTIDNVLRESIQRGDANAGLLKELSAKTAAVPSEVVSLLQPGFEYLHQEMRQAETRIMSKVMDVAYAGISEIACRNNTPDQKPDQDVIEQMGDL